ncbi:hypothetical protein [Leeuwenhoekiella sp. H156]
MKANDLTPNEPEPSESYKAMMDEMLLKHKEGKLEYTPVEEVLKKYS